MVICTNPRWQLVRSQAGFPLVLFPFIGFPGGGRLVISYSADMLCPGPLRLLACSITSVTFIVYLTQTFACLSVPIYDV